MRSGMFVLFAAFVVSQTSWSSPNQNKEVVKYELQNVEQMILTGKISCHEYVPLDERIDFQDERCLPQFTLKVELEDGQVKALQVEANEAGGLRVSDGNKFMLIGRLRDVEILALEKAVRRIEKKRADRLARKQPLWDGEPIKPVDVDATGALKKNLVVKVGNQIRTIESRRPGYCRKGNLFYEKECAPSRVEKRKISETVWKFSAGQKSLIVTPRERFLDIY